jgi:hypothetical protein
MGKFPVKQKNGRILEQMADFARIIRNFRFWLDFARDFSGCMVLRGGLAKQNPAAGAAGFAR